MRLAATVLVVLVMSFAAPAFGQSFVGEWKATAHTPGGEVSETITVVKTAKGYEIKTQLVVAPPEGTPQAGPGTDIVLDGDKFSYKRTLNSPGGMLVITYTGTVSGETFTGTVNLGGFAEAPYTGVRIKQDK
jgi:hypothetical protein